MVRNLLLRTLSFVAIVAAICLASMQAKAAIIPVCDADAFSGVMAVATAPATAPTAQAIDCALPLPSAGNDEIDPQVAAMCDARGASVVAPGRIHPMGDGRIDAVVTCDGTNIGSFVSFSHGEDGQAAFAWVVMNPALLPDSYVFPPASFVELQPFLPVEGDVLPGFGREIYHPPRAA